jgi:hypothetical protein
MFAGMLWSSHIPKSQLSKKIVPEADRLAHGIKKGERLIDVDWRSLDSL